MIDRGIRTADIWPRESFSLITTVSGGGTFHVPTHQFYLPDKTMEETLAWWDEHGFELVGAKTYGWSPGVSAVLRHKIEPHTYSPELAETHSFLTDLMSECAPPFFIGKTNKLNPLRVRGEGSRIGDQAPWGKLHSAFYDWYWGVNSETTVKTLTPEKWIHHICVQLEGLGRAALKDEFGRPAKGGKVLQACLREVSRRLLEGPPRPLRWMDLDGTERTEAFPASMFIARLWLSDESGRWREVAKNRSERAPKGVTRSEETSGAVVNS